MSLLEKVQSVSTQEPIPYELLTELVLFYNQQDHDYLALLLLAEKHADDIPDFCLRLAAGYKEYTSEDYDFAPLSICYEVLDIIESPIMTLTCTKDDIQDFTHVLRSISKGYEQGTMKMWDHMSFLSRCAQIYVLAMAFQLKKKK